MTDFNDYMWRAYDRTRPVWLKKSIEHQMLVSFALSDELVMVLERCGFEQKEIPSLNMNLFDLAKGR